MGNFDSVGKARKFAGTADFLLLDTDRPQVLGVGATGEVHDWKVSAEIVRQVNIPVILAGGLSPQNVQEAIQTVRPWAVDSYSHTNADDSRDKDIDKVKAFVRAAQQTD